jgi:hypothetical protein
MVEYLSHLAFELGLLSGHAIRGLKLSGEWRLLGAFESTPAGHFYQRLFERLHVDGRLRRSVAATGTENIGSPALKLRFPRGDLIGVDVELLRKLSQRSIALDGGKRTFALKAGAWFRRGRLLMVSPDSRGTACPPSDRNSTYRPVQISGTGSPFDGHALVAIRVIVIVIVKPHG